MVCHRLGDHDIASPLMRVREGHVMVTSGAVVTGLIGAVRFEDGRPWAHR
jgi:hypothetical protein